MVRGRTLYDRLLRWALYFIVRWIPPRGRGLRLASAVDALCPPTGLLYAGRVPGGARIECDLRDPVQRSIFYRGTYEPEITILIEDELGEGDTFVDVGANIGYFSLLAASRVGPTGRVLAFEPAVDLCTRLKSASEPAGRNSRRRTSAAVEVHAVALSDRSETTVLTSAVDNRNGERYLAENGEGDTVRTVALDVYLPGLRPNVVKIDVEGAELRVLFGMRFLLRTVRPRLVVVEAIEANLCRFGDSIGAIFELMEDVRYRGVLITGRYSAPMLAFRPTDQSNPSPAEGWST